MKHYYIRVDFNTHEFKEIKEQSVWKINQRPKRRVRYLGGTVRGFYYFVVATSTKEALGLWTDFLRT